MLTNSFTLDAPSERWPRVMIRYTISARPMAVNVAINMKVAAALTAGVGDERAAE